MGWPALAIVQCPDQNTDVYAIKKAASELSSPGLDAAAKDNLSDMATSMMAFVGIMGSNYLSPLLDPAAGALVALWIFRAVFFTARENLGYLTGAGADEELREKILDTVRSIRGVENVHHIITEYAGPRLVVEMHINVDGETTLNRSHEISDQAIADWKVCLRLTARMCMLNRPDIHKFCYPEKILLF